MVATAVVIALVLGGSLRAAAEDPPRPAAPPAAETPPSAPRQDPEGLAALRRLAELVPSPRSAGMRTVRCSVRELGGGFLGSPAVRIVLDWPESGRTSASIQAPDFLRAGAEHAQFEKSVIEMLLLPFQCRESWEPAVVARSDILSRRLGDDLVVTLSEPGRPPWMPLWIGGDGLPRHVGVAVLEAGRTAVWELEFARRGTRNALRSFHPPGSKPFGEISEFHSIPEFDLPRKISYAFPSGRREFVLHDVRVDGRRVEGTSFEEALAGRTRRVDAAAARVLARADSAVATLEGAGVGTASCMVEAASGEGSRLALLSWCEESGVRCRPLDLAADAPTDYAGAVWRAAWSLGRAAAELLKSPSAELAQLDVTAAAGDTVDATPLSEASLLDPRRMWFDERGLPVRIDQTSRANASTVTETRTWERLGRWYVSSGREAADSEGKYVWVVSWFLPDRGPPLIRRIEITLVRGASRSVTILNFTDWQLDGRRVVEAPK